MARQHGVSGLEFKRTFDSFFCRRPRSHLRFVFHRGKSRMLSSFYFLRIKRLSSFHCYITATNNAYTQAMILNTPQNTIIFLQLTATIQLSSSNLPPQYNFLPPTYRHNTIIFLQLTATIQFSSSNLPPQYNFLPPTYRHNTIFFLQLTATIQLSSSNLPPQYNFHPPTYRHNTIFFLQLTATIQFPSSNLPPQYNFLPPTLCYRSLL